MTRDDRMMRRCGPCGGAASRTITEREIELPPNESRRPKQQRLFEPTRTQGLRDERSSRAVDGRLRANWLQVPAPERCIDWRVDRE
jgi:hypothetical protein